MNTFVYNNYNNYYTINSKLLLLFKMLWFIENIKSKARLYYYYYLLYNIIITVIIIITIIIILLLIEEVVLLHDNNICNNYNYNYISNNNFNDT